MGTSTFDYSNMEDRAKPRARCYLYTLTICNFLAIFLIVFNLALFPFVFQALVNSQVVLTNTTLSFTQWLKPTPAIYKIVTVYNVTNPDVVAVGGQPELQALGPYYFREYREKINVEEVYDEDLWFNEKKWYEFDYNMTNSNLTNTSKPLDPSKDKFTTFNLAYIGVGFNLTYSGTPMEIVAATTVAAAEGEQSLFMHRTISEVVFGYKDKLLTALKIAKPYLSDTVQLVYNMSTVDETTISRVNTGRKNISLLGQYSHWQGQNKLSFWCSPEAQQINGTEGLFFAPNLDKTKPITTFVDDLFRANPMEFVGEEECMGMKTYKYFIPKYVLANSTINPLNKGFYADCPNGLMNLTAAVMAPVFASKPSFLDAEEWLQKEVTGLPPADNNTMDTNLWVEPITGALVKARKQLQANMMLMNLPKFPKLNKLRAKPRYVPISKIIETGGMDDDLVQTFRNKVFKPRDDFVMILWALFGLCTFLGGMFCFLFVRIVRNNQKESTLLIPDEGKGSNVYS